MDKYFMEEYYKRAKRYVNTVKRAIKQDYGCVPAEWEAQLVQLEDMYANYLLAAAHVRQDGDPIVAINDGKTICASAYFSAMVQCTKTMDKIVKSFGLTPLARKNLKGITQLDEDDCFSDL